MAAMPDRVQSRRGMTRARLDLSRRSVPVSLLTLGVFLASFVPAPRTEAAGSALQTEKVVLVCIDGVRNLDALKNPAATPLGQVPAFHPLLPRIWSEVAPRSTVFLDCKTVEQSFTTPGFNTILSGVWQHGPNRSRRDDHGYFDNRSESPSLFEYFAQARGERALMVHNKKNVLVTDFSIHPVFGSAFAPEVVFVDPGRGAQRYTSDGELYDVVIQTIDENEPDFLFVAFGSVDLAGHSQSFGIYGQTLMAADRYVADLWAYLQTHPAYQGRTTLILTTDHGRHLEGSYGGFAGHGGMCDGCRDLMALVAGPDTPEGQIVTRRTYQIDFAPTVARFLGVSAPFAEGTLLAEAFGEPAQDNVLKQRRPFVAAEGNSAFLGYERLRHGSQEIHVAVSQDEGETFLQDLDIAAFNGQNAYSSVAKDPRLLVNRRNGRDLLQVVWLDLQDPEGRWVMRHRMADLTDFQVRGARILLGPVRAIGESLFEGERPRQDRVDNNGLTVESPSFISIRGPAGRREIVASSAQRYSLGFRFSDTAFQPPEQESTKAVFPEDRYFFSDPHLAAGQDQDVFVVWRDISEEVYTDLNGDGALDPLFTWNVRASLSRDGGQTWARAVRLTRSASASLAPKIVYLPHGGPGDGPQVLVAYADTDASGLYQIYLRRGFVDPDNNGRGPTLRFGPAEALTSSCVGAWYPDLVVDRPVSGQGVHLVYTDFGRGQGDVFYRYSPDGRVFSQPLNVSRSATPSQRPSLAIFDSGRRFVAWEELDGNGVSTIESRGFDHVVPDIGR